MGVDADKFREFERTAHDRLSQSYHEFFTPVTALALDGLLGSFDIKPGFRVLDVACGPGGVAAALKRRGAHVTGIDLAPGMVALASQLNPGIEFREGNVEALPFPDRSFNAVVCNFGLGHFPRPEEAVSECVRVLVPGGAVAFSWWDFPERQRIQGVFREAIAEVGAAPPDNAPQGHPLFRFSDNLEFQRLLEGSGLARVTVRDYATCFLIPSVDALWQGGLGSLAVTGATVLNQPEEIREKIRAAVAHRVEEYRTKTGLRIPIAFKIGTGCKPAFGRC